MSLFWIVSLPIYASRCSQFVGVKTQTESCRFIRLVSKTNFGLIDTETYDAKLLQQYQGFEVYPSELGVSVALLDEQDRPWIYNGSTWIQATGYNTPAQVRTGISSWKNPLKFRLRLERSRDGISPKIQEVRFGCEFLYGSPLAYLFKFGINRFFASAQPILNRWLDQEPTLSKIEGVNPDRISSLISSLKSQQVLESQQVEDAWLAAIKYQPLVIPLSGEEFHQIEETPCVLLEMAQTENHRQISEVDSIPVSETEMVNLSFSRVFDQRINITVVAQTTEDVQAIADSLIALIDSRGSVEAPPFGLKFGIVYNSDLEWGISSATPNEKLLDTAQLASASFTVSLLAIPSTPYRSNTQTVKSLEVPFLHPITSL